MMFLVNIGLTQCFSQIRFTNNQADWIACKLTQLEILKQDSIYCNQSLLLKDSINKVLNKKIELKDFEIYENHIVIYKFTNKYNLMSGLNYSLNNKLKKGQKALIIIGAITLIKNAIIIYAIKK